MWNRSACYRMFATDFACFSHCTLHIILLDTHKRWVNIYISLSNNQGSNHSFAVLKMIEGLKPIYNGVLRPFARLLARMGIHPNALTVFGVRRRWMACCTGLLEVGAACRDDRCLYGWPWRGGRSWSRQTKYLRGHTWFYLWSFHRNNLAWQFNGLLCQKPHS